MARQTVLPAEKPVRAGALLTKKSPRNDTEMVHMMLPATRLAHLLSTGALRVTDFQCLDQSSKHVVWRALLNSLRGAR